MEGEKETGIAPISVKNTNALFTESCLYLPENGRIILFDCILTSIYLKIFHELAQVF